MEAHMKKKTIVSMISYAVTAAGSCYRPVLLKFQY